MSKITTSILKTLQKAIGQQVLLPFYHAVTDTTLNFTNQLYPPRSIANFKNDLDTLLAHYQPISLQELIALNKSEEKLKQAYFHLTFDDGLSNFYYEIAPILKEKNIPATVFLNTNFVNNKDLFFRYKASLLLGKYINSNSQIKQVFEQFLTKKNNQNVAEYLLAINYQNKHELNDLAQKVNYNFTDFLAKEKPYLSLAQIQELQAQGFTFGAHSTDHPLFANLSLNAQLKQVTDSMNWLDKNLKLDYKAFSFPFEDAAVSHAFFKQANLDISFGTYGIKKDTVPNNLQRISFEYADTNTKLFLIKEQLKYLLKIPLRKHLIKRQ